jgi:Domain of Unknown Function (DUF349)
MTDLATPAHVPQSAAAALVGDPSSFGRVGEDGTVYVRTDSGERAVGSYPGKSNEEALAYFVRKFETLAAEVALTADRLRNGAMLAEDGEEAIKKLRQQVESINAVGNLAALKIAVENISPLAAIRREEEAVRKAAAAEAKQAARAEAKILKEKLVEEAEMICATDAWKVVGDRLKVLLDEWKKATRLDKATDEALWKRFSSARNAFDKRRRTHFASLDKQRTEFIGAKEALIAEAEKLSTSTDWVNTARKYKALMDSWKAAGRAGKSDEDKLWKRFKAAQDAFFAAKEADFAKREESFSANLAVKEGLLVEAEALLPVTKVGEAKRALRTIQEKWEKAGQLPRNVKDKFDSRLRAVEKVIRELDQEESRRTDPVERKRAQENVDKLAEAVANYEKQAAKAAAAGDAKKEKEAREAADARRLWLTEAEKSLAQYK